MIMILGSISPSTANTAVDQPTKISSPTELDDSLSSVVDRPSISYSYSSHTAIEISGDTDFTSANGVVSGSGNQGDPFIIEGWNISTSSEHGIYVHDTSAHFIIRNCWINDTTSRGIYAADVVIGTATIVNNHCQNNGFAGIGLSNADNSTVFNNTCVYNNLGIAMYYSANSTITNNTCNNNNKAMILLQNQMLTIANNTCENNNAGIEVYECGLSVVENNTCINNGEFGIKLLRSGSSVATNNLFENCGMDVSDNNVDNFLTYSINSNSVNGLPLGFFANEHDLTLSSGYGQLILVNCTNVLIKDMDCSNTSKGIYLYSCSDVEITNSTFNNSYFGIHLHNSISCEITNNVVQNNKKGIYLFFTGFSNVSNNFVANTQIEGLSIVYSDNCKIENNTCSQNRYGVNIHSSNYASVENNTCFNSELGIRLFDVEYGIINNNTCEANDYGIHVDSSDDTVISENVLINNLFYGVYLDTGYKKNKIYRNNFFSNNDGSCQAYDSGANNEWYDSSTNEGNYWSDYSGTGSYLIDGAGASDPYPLSESAIVGEFTVLRGYFLGLFAFFGILNQIRRKNKK